MDTTKELIKEIWELWESMAECGELHIGPQFSANYKRLKAQVEQKLNSSGIGSKRLKVKTGDLIECEGKVFVFGKDRGTGEIKTFNISNMEAACASGGEATVAAGGGCGHRTIVWSDTTNTGFCLECNDFVRKSSEGQP